MYPETTPIVNGLVVRTLRLRQHLTQRDLGVLCGSYQQHISDIERGIKVHVYPATLARLSAALGVAMEDLVGEEDRRPRPGRETEA
jgi:transcriptional regulator with XRE-family HTH domain